MPTLKIKTVPIEDQKAPQSQAETLEVTPAEVATMRTEDGDSAANDGALLNAEATLTPQIRHRHRTLTTGHKLRILQDLKSGMNQTKLCQKHRLTKSAIALIVADDSLQETVNGTWINQTKKYMAARFYQLADMALGYIDPKKLERLDPYKLGVLASIALDKARLIEGQSTENLSFRSLAMNVHGSLEELRERKRKLVEFLETKHTQHALDSAPKRIEG